MANERSQLLHAHLREFEKSGRRSLILIGKRTSVERALSEMDGRAPSRLKVLCTDQPGKAVPGAESLHAEGEWWAGIDAAVLVDAVQEDVMAAQATVGSLKDEGIPVATAYARQIFTSAPAQRNQGIDYGGMFTLAGFFARSLGTAGDYFEFGVFDGRTMTLAYHTLGRFIPQMRFIGFDTFSGIRGANASESKFRDGSYYCNKPTLLHNLTVAGVPRERVRIVEGDIRETTADAPALQEELGLSRCLVANIDCDVYAPAKAALNFLTRLVDSGTLLLFDEYDQWAGDANKGERRALHEWLEENPQFEVEHYRSYAWGARAFIVHRVE